MDITVRLVVVFSAALLGSRLGGAPESAPVSPAAGEETAPAIKRDRVISPRVASLLAAKVPKFEAPPPTEARSAVAVADKPANDIIRLPDYIVREQRLPQAQEVMTQKALAQFAMARYMGPEDGLDRGFLNLFTLAQFWQKIPIIGMLIPAPFGSITNEQRALAYYAEDERLRKMKELYELAAMAGKSGDGPSRDTLKREVQKTFLRDPSFGW